MGGKGGLDDLVDGGAGPEWGVIGDEDMNPLSGRWPFMLTRVEAVEEPVCDGSMGWAGVVCCGGGIGNFGLGAITGGGRLEDAWGWCSSWVGRGLLLEMTVGGLDSLMELDLDRPGSLGEILPSLPSCADFELEVARGLWIAPVLLNPSPADTGGLSISLVIFRSDPPTSIPFPDNAFIRSAILPIEVVSGPEALTVDDVEDELGLEALYVWAPCRWKEGKDLPVSFDIPLLESFFQFLRFT
jgi:hypothetical protein